MSDERPDPAELFRELARAFADPGDWDCTAYGKGSRAAGHLCFFSRDDRDCWTIEHCRERMAEQREGLFEMIQRKAAAGDPNFQYLAQQFTSPDQLLNPDYDPEPPDER